MRHVEAPTPEAASRQVAPRESPPSPFDASNQITNAGYVCDQNGNDCETTDRGVRRSVPVGFRLHVLPREKCLGASGPPVPALRLASLASWAPYGFERPTLRALRAAIRSSGDGQAVITDCEAEPSHLYPTMLDAMRDSIYQAYSAGPIGADAALFGASATWGVYFEYEWRVAYVGGVPQFMDVFLQGVGGADVLKQELRQVVAETGSELELRGIREALARVGWTDI